MKIILSPSKTANYHSTPLLTTSELRYPMQTKKLVLTIRKLSQKDLSKALNIKGDLVKQTHLQYQDFHKSNRHQAFPSYNGLVFKQLQKELYTNTEYTYINNHVVILDALYGIVEPSTLIAPYRLDMKAKLGFNLYQYWHVDDYFTDELIINLASTEFSAMIHKPFVTVHFMQKKGKEYIQQATYSKMGRGLLLHYMILHKIETIEELIQFNQDGYGYDSLRSTKESIVFTR